MMAASLLIGKRVMLREVAWGDLEAREGWLADPDVVRFLGFVDGRPGPNLEDRSGCNMEWTIALKETQEPVGIAQFGHMDPLGHQASLGLVIGRKDLWGQGLGRDTIDVLLGFGFGVLGLNRIYLTVEARHEKAIRLYERLGFRTEGRLREARFTSDGLQDVLVMAVLSDEWIEAAAGREEGR